MDEIVFYVFFEFIISVFLSIYLFKLTIVKTVSFIFL
ncbi:putative membrane protein, partial [Yersinia pestis PY-19]